LHESSGGISNISDIDHIKTIKNNTILKLGINGDLLPAVGLPVKITVLDFISMKEQ
jgi:hypothetical protein